jgi:hypothetical protein
MFGFKKKQPEVEVETAEREELPEGCEALDDSDFAEVSGSGPAPRQANL